MQLVTPQFQSTPALLQNPQPGAQGYQGVLPQQPAATDSFKPSAKPMSAIRFGACVNRETKVDMFQDLVYNGILQDQLHALASASVNGTTEAVEDEIINMMLGQGEAQKKAITGGPETPKMAILALVESALQQKDMTPERKKKLIDALKKAKRKPWMNTPELQAMLDEAIKRLEHDGKNDKSAAWKRAEHEAQHKAGHDHGHAH